MSTFTSDVFYHRGSENNVQNAFGKRKSFRTSSFKRKQQRSRPEITIVSSQPMNHHPAFADGNKGSCVPPEAPPSYEEVVKDSTPDNHSFDGYSSSESCCSCVKQNFFFTKFYLEFIFRPNFMSICNVSMFFENAAKNCA